MFDGVVFASQGVYKQVPLDGIWLDMNEVSNYCSGDVCVDPGTSISILDEKTNMPVASIPHAY